MDVYKARYVYKKPKSNDYKMGNSKGAFDYQFCLETSCNEVGPENKVGPGNKVGPENKVGPPINIPYRYYY